MSHNDRWVYDVRETSRSNPNRGLWYENKGQSKPSLVTFDVPGGWYRILTKNNNDEKANSRTFPIDVGGGDIDFFNGLDAQRTAQGWKRFQESGQADGVAFSSPIEIDGLRFDVAFQNPNAISRAIVGYRESGAEDWEEAYSDGTAHATPTASGVQDITFTTDIRHLAAYLWPANDEVIPTSWIRDTGSRTGGGASTFQDNTKAWATNQWANGSIRIVSGKGAGQSRTISSNTSTTLTLSSNWNIIPGDDARYEIRNQLLVATLRHNTIWEVRLNTSKIFQSAIGAQITNYSLTNLLFLGGGPDGVFPYQQIQLGANNRKIHVASTEELRIDGARRRAGIYLTSSGVFQRDASAAVSVKDAIVTNLSLLAPDWLLVPPNPPPPSQLPNTDFAANITGWNVSSTTAGVTRTDAWDNTQGHLVNGTYKVGITASTAGVGAIAFVLSPFGLNGIPITQGRPYTVTAWGRSDLRNWVAKLGISWYSAAGSSLGTSQVGIGAVDYVATVDTWYPIAVSAVPLANAAYGVVTLIAYQRVASSLDTVWFDEIRWDTTALYMVSQSAGVTSNITASLTEGYLG
jgi:hypothetical protein